MHPISSKGIGKGFIFLRVTGFGRMVHDQCALTIYGGLNCL